VWSTIPLTTLAKSVSAYAPPDVLQAMEKINYRSLILIYLVLEQDRFSEYDAHYFPDSNIRISRLSEPKNYNDVREPQNVTVLCAELPCARNDFEWNQSNEELGQLVCSALDAVGIPVRAQIRQVVTRRLSQAYPIYRQGYEVYFDCINQWMSQIENLLTFGRQGLFVHDNIHHALYMAYAAVQCLKESGSFDNSLWQSYKQIFHTFVVED
jgi:protoporphyrinogen oxidase